MYALLIADKQTIFYIRMFKTVKAIRLEIKENADIAKVISSGEGIASIEKVAKDGNLEIEYEITKDAELVKIDEFGFDFDIGVAA